MPLSPRSLAARLAAFVQHSLLAPASSARAAQRTRSQSVRAAVQAIVRQGELVEAAFGLGEASEGEESDE